MPVNPPAGVVALHDTHVLDCAPNSTTAATSEGKTAFENSDDFKLQKPNGKDVLKCHSSISSSVTAAEDSVHSQLAKLSTASSSSRCSPSQTTSENLAVKKRIRRKRATGARSTKSTNKNSEQQQFEVVDDAKSFAHPCGPTPHPHTKNSPEDKSLEPMMKHCNLRSTAPILYDLLSENCDADCHKALETRPVETQLNTPTCSPTPTNFNFQPLLTMPLPFAIEPAFQHYLNPFDQLPLNMFNNIVQQSLLLGSPIPNLQKLCSPEILPSSD